MTLFASRRTFDAARKRFTNNISALTRYVEVTSQSGRVSGGHLVEKDEWRSKVKLSAQSRDILVWVHGFNTSQTEMIARQRKIDAGLRGNGFQGAVIGFDWPSDGRVTRYASDKTDAKKAAPFLVTEVLGLFLNESPRYRLHVIAHSMGVYLTLRGFSGVGDAPGARAWGVDQVAFVAGDAQAEWMRKGAWGSLTMAHRAQRLTNYYSTDDTTLQVAGGLVNGPTRRVGYSGMPDLIATGHEDLRTTEQYRDKVPQSERDVVRSHNWYYDDAGFYKDLAMTLAGQDGASMSTRRNSTINDRVLLT